MINMSKERFKWDEEKEKYLIKCCLELAEQQNSTSITIEEGPPQDQFVKKKVYNGKK